MPVKRGGILNRQREKPDYEWKAAVFAGATYRYTQSCWRDEPKGVAHA